jgi:hypothetical protein
MALPRQLPTGYDAGPIVGPFISSGGAAYYIGTLDSDNRQIDALKSANPSTTAFSVVGTGPDGSSTWTVTEDVDVFQVGDVLHVAVIGRTTPAMGDATFYWNYFSFDMSSDSWTLTGGPEDYDIWNFTIDRTLSTGQIRIMRRSYGNAGDGTYDIVIVGKGTAAAYMGSPYDTVYHGYWDADNTTPQWNPRTRIDEATDGVHYRHPMISNDYTTDGDYMVSWWDATSNSVDGRMVAALTHQKKNVQEHLATGGGVEGSRASIQYNDSGTWRGRALHGAGANTVSVSKWDPTLDNPTVTQDNDITGADNAYNRYGLLCYDSANDTLYCIYVEAVGLPTEIKYVSSVSEAAWGDITLHSAPSNDTQLIYGRAVVGSSPVDGGDVIAFLYQDNVAGTAYYDEISIAAGSAVTTGTGSLSLAGLAPTSVIPQLLTTATAALSLTGVTPTAAVPTLIEAQTASTTLTGIAPNTAISDNIWVTTGTGALDLSAFAPTAAVATSITSGTGDLTLTGGASEQSVGNFWGYFGAASDTGRTIGGAAPRLGGGQFSPGAGTYVVRKLFYSWGFNSTVTAVRLGVYKNTSLSMDNAELVHDAGVVDPIGTGKRFYDVTPFNINHNDYIFIGAKTNDTVLTWFSHDGASAGDLADEFSGSAIESNDETDAWDDPAPTDYNQVTSEVPAVGLWYNAVTTVTPGTASLTLTGIAPTATAAVAVQETTGTGALSLTGIAPTPQFGTRVTTGTGSLSLTGIAPTSTYNQGVTTGTGSLALTGIAPNTSIDYKVTSGTGALSLVGFVPTTTFGTRVTTAAGSLVLAGIAPDETIDVSITPATGSLILSGLASTASFSQTASSATGSLTLTGIAPTSLIDITVTSATGSLVLTGLAADETIVLKVVSGTGALVLTGIAPATSIDYKVTTGTGNLTLSGLASAASYSQSATTGTGSLVLSGLAPTSLIEVTVTSATGSLVLTGVVSTVAIETTETTATGSLVLSGIAPTVRIDTTVASATGALTLNGIAPSTLIATTVTTATGSLILEGIAPSEAIANTATTETGSLLLSGVVPTTESTANVWVTTSTGSLVLTGLAPTAALPGTEVTGTGSLVLTGIAPSISTPVTETTATGSLVLTGIVPTATVTEDVTATTATGSLILSGLAPSSTVTTNQAVTTGTGSLTLGSVAPITKLRITPATASLILTSFAAEPDFSAWLLTTSTGSLVLNGGSGTRAKGPSNIRKLIELYTILLAQTDFLLSVWTYEELSRIYNE